MKKIVIPQRYVEESDGFYEIVHIPSWAEAKEMFKVFNKDWIFRGQKEQGWSLEPSIERKTGHASPDDLDRIIVEALKKDVSLDEKLPRTDLDWLAFAQHHGGMTRLLDFTFDPYIACFFAFALNETSLVSKACAIWVVNKNWCLRGTLKKLKPSKFKNFFTYLYGVEKYFVDYFVFNVKFEPCVCPVNSRYKTLRMKRQKSIFLCKVDPVYSFEVNLVENDHLHSREFVKKIVLPSDLREEAMVDLRKKRLTGDRLLPGANHFDRMSEIVRRFEKEARDNAERLKREV